MTRVLISVAVMVAVAGLLTTLLALARWKLAVQRDPRIETVAEWLPQANCGACGYPGCRPFAEALVRGVENPAGCTVSSEAERGRIAAYLGVAVRVVERRVARLACAGGNNVAHARAHYRGVASCAAADRLGGGGKACAWGCLGHGDCDRACTFDAIRMNRHGLPVVDGALCTACGDCVDACPRDLFSLLPQRDSLVVRCRSQERGEAALESCEVACNACGRCAMDAPGLVRMVGNLPVVSYDAPHPNRDAIERCPTGAIVWADATGDVKGRGALHVVRVEALPPVAS